MQAVICRSSGRTDIEAEIKIFFSVFAFFDLLTLLLQKSVQLGNLFLDKKPFFSSAG